MSNCIEDKIRIIVGKKLLPSLVDEERFIDGVEDVKEKERTIRFVGNLSRASLERR